MGAQLEFVLPFNTQVIDKPEYKTLSEFLVLPVHVGQGEVIAKIVKSKGVLSGEENSVLFSIPDGQGVQAILSRNVAVSDKDKTALVSEIDGYLCAQDEKLVVTKLCEIYGDAGPLTGDMDFPSSIRIHGAVHTGYKIESGGSIEVLGLVEGAQLKAKGSISLKGGIAGVDEGIAQAGKDIYAKFAQQCRMESGGSIVIDGPSMDCDLNAGKQIVIRGGAALVGGFTRSKMGLSVAKIGSEGGTPTEVELGYNPSYARKKAELGEMLEKFKNELSEKKKEAKFAMNEFTGVVEYRSDDPLSAVRGMSELVRDKGLSEYSSEKKEKFQRLGATILKVAHLRETVREIAGDSGEVPAEKGYAKTCLKVEKIAHPGVKITMLGHTMLLDREYESVKFAVKDNKIEPIWI